MSALDASSSIWARWRYAAKLGSWPKLVVPTVLGQALGIVASGVPLSGQVFWGGLAFGVAFTAFDLLAIVFLNDWGDRRVDAIKRRMFPDGCSLKTIPDEILPAAAVLGAGLVALGLLVLVAALGARVLDRPHLLPLGLIAALWFQIYTFAPVRLNYRGGGELVEAIGVGAMLPLVNAYAQSGLLWHPAYSVLIGFVLLSLASALASGLSDEESDRVGGKRTFATMFGNAAVRRATEWTLACGISIWLAVGVWVAEVPWVAAGVACAVALWHVYALRRSSPAAVTNAFAAQARYKHQLHLAIWRGATVFAVLALVCSHLG